MAEHYYLDYLEIEDTPLFFIYKGIFLYSNYLTRWAAIDIIQNNQDGLDDTIEYNNI